MVVNLRQLLGLLRPAVRLALLGGGLGLGACSMFGSSLDGFAGGESKKVQCTSPLTECGGTCVDPNSDPKNCGACGTDCGAQVCANGTCSDTCPTGTENCSGACVNVNTDAQHCGACGTPCGAGDVCAGGQCSTSCFPGQTSCGGSCVDTQTDDQHCGACDAPCAVGQKCTAGKCEASCTTGQTLCSGLCVDVQSSSQHCGSCGNACAAGQVCNAGACKIACPGGQVECSGLCYDLQSDLNNCGACGNKCAAGEVCTNGTCALNCAAGQTACTGACVDLQTDAANCGACGTACKSNEECTAGKCVIACKTLLNQQITDPWGQAWDGLERAASNYATAKTTCEGIGGRLPTATELYRVSATQSATVGQTIHTNYLWAANPYNPTTQLRVRLSDASVSSLAETSSTNYRCVCPPPLPSTFVGNNCHGPSGQACYALDTEGKRTNIDIQDRAPQPVASAVWECAFSRGRLAGSLTLFEAMQQGLPNGSNAWVHTSDMTRYDLNALYRWQNTVTKPTVTAQSSWGGISSFRPFRCVGVNYDSGPHPATISGEFVAPLTRLKVDGKDSAATEGWPAASDGCFAKGGHVPTAAELVEAIQQGLPDGSNGWVWTSDQVGYNTAQFLLQLVRWTGTAPEFGFSYSGDTTWGYKHNGSRLTRCAYYPVDTAYAGPKGTDCAGGCLEIALPGGSGAKMWIDNFDRAPNATLEDAIDACRKLGGHLPSERDFLEAIKQSLPNGTNNWLWTSDLSVGAITTNSLHAQIIRWTGVEAATFTDQYSTYNTWSSVTGTRPYRCVWSNELD